MPSTRLRFLLPLLAAPIMVQAQAPLVYMQFGSFETAPEAQARLEQVAKDHAGMLGRIPLGVHEVAVGENVYVYRTQAGPIESRNTAQLMCGQLASNGDACYIVETAIQRLHPVAPEVQKAAEPARLLAAENTKSDVRAEAAEMPEEVSHTNVTKPLTGRAHAAIESLSEVAKEKPSALEQPAIPSRRIAPPTLQQPRMARDARNVQTLAQLSTDAMIQEAAPMEPSSEMEAALAEAASAVPDSQNVVPNSFEHAEDGSFWDAINPFSSNDDTSPSVATPKEEVAKHKTVEPAYNNEIHHKQAYSANDEQLANDAEQLTEQHMNVETDREASTQSRLSTDQASAPSSQQVIAPQEAEKAIASTPLSIPSLEEARRDMPRASIDDIINNRVATQPKPLIDSGLPLPAPPLPKNIARQQLLKQPQIAPAVTHIPVVQTRALPPAQVPSISPPAATIVTAVLPDGAAIEVEEAKRVPLSNREQNTESLEEEVRRPVVAYASPSGITADGMPSQSRLNKTQWAQLNYFDTPQKALGFWEGFRSSHPDFPVVRVRVTSPYSALLSSKKRFSLRVGPLANGRFVETLCDSDPVDDDDLECRSMGDLGVSANHALDHQENAATYRPSRYGPAARGIDALSGFWVQLGTYNSVGKAEQSWEDMKREYRSVLSSMQAQVSTPYLGSQARAVYRLRTGPFVNQKAAEELCSRLQEEQARCLVVAEQKS